MTFMQDYREGTVRLYFVSAEEMAFKIEVFIGDSVSEDAFAPRVKTKAGFYETAVT